MQSDNIIEKARQLGLNTGNSSSSADNLRTIASQVGFSEFNSIYDLNKLENILDQRLSEARDSEKANISDIEQLDNGGPIRNEKFGQKEYDKAKKDGVYDSNHYKAKQQELDKKAEELNQERQKNWKMKNGENGPVKADGSNTKRKSKMDRVMDNLNYAKAKKDAITNKIDEAKANTYNALHPVEHAKNLAESKVKNAVNQAKKQIGNKAKMAAKAAGKKIVAFIAANPWVLLVIVVAVILVIVILFLVSAFGGADSGYYNEECNFNSANVILKSCNSEDTQNYSLSDYIYGVTSYLVNGEDVNDETLKAIMIIVKTNALSYGNYNSAQKILQIDDCTYAFNYDLDDEEKEKYSSIYSTINNYLYVSTSYDSVINNMTPKSALSIDKNTVKEMNDMELNYNEILDELYNNSDESVQGNYYDTLYLGDSIIEGMVLTGVINSNNAVYNKDYSYTTLSNVGIDSINSKITDGKKYNIVVGLGINDFINNNADKYYSKYYELASGVWKDHNVYILPINSVAENNDLNISNNDINSFNQQLKSKINNSGLANLHYIEISFNTNDLDATGLGYTNTGYKNIYTNIQQELDFTLNSDYKLYNLAEYCTYYTLTKNDAYWWPIGSREPTSGNIYGGSPSSTTITSTFGPRTLGGATGNHGAIDIGASCNDNVVIASKDGVVKRINDSCDNNGSLSNTCGGGLGNYVMIEHEDGTETRYGHMYPGSVSVTVGEKVKQGQKLGMVGTSGNSTGCHLHFEIRINDQKVDPLKYVDPDNPRPILSTNINIVAGDEGGQENVCKALLASGFSKQAVAGIMVNMAAESSFRTDAVEYASGHTINDIFDVGDNEAAGFGLVQWSFGRRVNVINYARNNGMSPTSLKAQLEYFNKELNESYAITNKYVTGNYSASEIGLNFCLDFERPANKNVTCRNRVNSNINYYENYVNNGCG